MGLLVQQGVHGHISGSQGWGNRRGVAVFETEYNNWVGKKPHTGTEFLSLLYPLILLSPCVCI
jgi:hypothetical protein